MGTRRRSWITLALALAACSPRPAPRADPATAAASAASPELCAAGEARCENDDESASCAEDRRSFRRARCQGGSICAAGLCVALRAPDDRVIPRERLLDVGPDGWLSAWSLASPLAAKLLERIALRPADAFALGPETAFRPLCSDAGYVTALAKVDGRPPSPNRALLTGLLVAGRAGPVRVKLGVTGGIKLWLGDALIVDATRPPSGARPFQDELDVAASLREGVNPIAILVEQTGEPAVGFWLRVRGADGRPIPELRFALGAPENACSPSELLHVESAPSPVAGGFELALEARFRGLAPRAPVELPYRATLSAEGGAPGVDLQGGALRLDAMRAKGAPFTLTARPPRQGKVEIALTIGDGPDAIRRKLPLTYDGALHERIVALREQLPAIRASAAPEASRESLAIQIGTLSDALATGVSDLSWIGELTADAEKLAGPLARGEDPYRTKTGIVRRAYRSRLDGKVQPYVLFVPRSYQPGKKPLALVLAFHGLNRLPEHALRTVIGEAPDEDMSLAFAARHLPAFPDLGAIIAAPFGYGSAGARTLGEEDVLRVVEEIRAEYDVDPRRISLTGYSLGGTVAFVVPLHHPDLFAASAPLCGYPNLATYDSVVRAPHTPWEDVLLAKRYIVNYCENGLYLPLNIVHGGLDGPARSEVVARRYAELGYRRIFDVQDDLDHNVWDYAYEDAKMVAWLTARKRPEAPAHVRFVTGEYQYDRAYWVRLVAMKDSRAPTDGLTLPGFADIDAQWKKASHELEVTTRNVAALALDLGALGEGSAQKVVIDGAELDVAGATGALFLERSGGAWTRSATEPRRAGKKRHGVSGPLDDVLHHALLVVYGTRDPLQTEANLMVADHFSSNDSFAYAHYPVKADVDVEDAELVGRSLVLIGNPASNSIAERFSDSFPVRFEPSALVIGDRRFEGADVGVSLIRPHPRDPAEYVVLHAGVGAAGTLESRNLPQLSPDWLVYDARITAQRGELLLDKREVLAGGFFDDDWR